jgi:hypothetical protein
VKRLLLLLSLTGVASADTVKPPPTWTADSALAVKLSKDSSALPHFGGRQSIVTTEVYRTGQATLFVHKISAALAGADGPARDRAASAELRELILASKRIGATAKIDSLTASAIGENLLEGWLRWHDDTTTVVSVHRMIVAADEQQVVAVHGECLWPQTTASTVRKACDDALASLDPGIAPDRRVKLAVVQASEPAPEPAAGSAKPAPSLVESGERPSLPPMQIPQAERESDRRPIYVGLGLIVLAVIFYLNRKNREKLEREYETRTADKVPPAKAADRDADDLHAAAETKEDTKS